MNGSEDDIGVTHLSEPMQSELMGPMFREPSPSANTQLPEQRHQPSSHHAQERRVSHAPTQSRSGMQITDEEAKEGGDEEAEEDVPWYMDPSSYQRPIRASAAGETAQRHASQPSQWSAQPLAARSAAFKPPQQSSSQSPQGLFPPAANPTSSETLQNPQSTISSLEGRPHTSYLPDMLLSHGGPANPGRYHNSEPRHQGAETAGPPQSLPLPLLQALGRPDLYQPASPPRSHTSMAGHLPSTADSVQMLPPQKQAQLQAALYQELELARQREGLSAEVGAAKMTQDEDEILNAQAEPWSPPLRSYSQAWTQMLEVCFSDWFCNSSFDLSMKFAQGLLMRTAMQKTEHCSFDGKC